MASGEPLLQNEEEPTFKSTVKKGCKTCLKGLASIFLVVFILSWILQGIMYYWATSMSGCRASNLEGYQYPGGEASDAGDAAFNVMPRISLLAERTRMWYGEGFDVIPSNEASNVASAPVGTWWQNWGPWFYTYTYEDISNSKTTVTMRRKLLRIGQCHVIQRCDGQGPTVTFTEGTNWLANRLRNFFKMNQGMIYKIYLDNDLVGVAEETQHGFQSLTFRNKETGMTMASSVLKERHFHGDRDLWLVKNNEKDELLPYYVSSAATLLFAFHTINEDARKVVAEGHLHKKDEAPDPHGNYFLAANLTLASKGQVPELVNKAPELERASASTELESAAKVPESVNKVPDVVSAKGSTEAESTAKAD